MYKCNTFKNQNSTLSAALRLRVHAFVLCIWKHLHLKDVNKPHLWAKSSKNVWAAANGLKQKSSVIRSHHDEHWHREVPLTRVREQIWSVLLGKGQVKRSMWTRLAGLPLTTNPVSHLYLCFRSILLSIHRVVRCSSFYSPFISHCNSHTPSPPPPCPSHPFILWYCTIPRFLSSVICTRLFKSVHDYVLLSLSLCTRWASNQKGFSVKQNYVYSLGSF